MKPMMTIAIINQKGGVGKTTAAANLGAALASRHGKGVLLIDLDPQSNLTASLGYRQGAACSAYDVLIRQLPIANCQLPIANYPGLQLLPSDIALASAEIELSGAMRREYRLKTAIDEYRNDNTTGYILIDCPPALGLLVINALTAACQVLIPVQVEYLPLKGLAHLLDTLATVRRAGLNPALKIAGVLPCRYDPRNGLHREVLETLRREVPQTLKTVIRQNIALAEAPSHGKTIFEYAPKSAGAADFTALAEEIDQT